MARYDEELVSAARRLLIRRSGQRGQASERTHTAIHFDVVLRDFPVRVRGSKQVIDRDSRESLKKKASVCENTMRSTQDFRCEELSVPSIIGRCELTF